MPTCPNCGHEKHPLLACANCGFTASSLNPPAERYRPTAPIKLPPIPEQASTEVCPNCGGPKKKLHACAACGYTRPRG